MLPHPVLDPFYVKAVAEHRQLCALVDQLEKRLDEGQDRLTVRAASTDLPEMFESLRHHLRQHFAEEEAGGLVEEAICRLPRLGPRANALERQHAPLMRRCEELTRRAHSCGCAGPHFVRLAKDFRTFRRALMEHEEAENRLTTEAFNAEVNGAR